MNSWPTTSAYKSVFFDHRPLRFLGKRCFDRITLFNWIITIAKSESGLRLSWHLVGLFSLAASGAFKPQQPILTTGGLLLGSRAGQWRLKLGVLAKIRSSILVTATKWMVCSPAFQQAESRLKPKLQTYQLSFDSPLAASPTSLNFFRRPKLNLKQGLCAVQKSASGKRFLATLRTPFLLG